jgi:4-hydroxybenzoate polyprenyltransferase
MPDMPLNKPIDLFRLMRPHQWLKNGFVFIGLIFSHAWYDMTLVAQVILAALSFCLAASSIYIFNDISDREKDKIHPDKKHRPLAAGKVSSNIALILGLLLAGSSLGIGLASSAKVAVILLTYIVLNCLYSWILKQIVIIDVFCIASGFMLRILAGTVGVNIPPSKWLLFCGLTLTLFLGFTKRRAEMELLGENKVGHRKVFEHYSRTLLDKFISVTATMVILSYSLYTMSPETINVHGTDNLIYTVPFIIYGIFRYIYLLHICGGGNDPSRELVRDPHILATVIMWLLLTLWVIA